MPYEQEVLLAPQEEFEDTLTPFVFGHFTEADRARPRLRKERSWESAASWDAVRQNDIVVGTGLGRKSGQAFDGSRHAAARYHD